MKLLPVTKDLNVVLELQGSKSIANRVILLASISSGTSIIKNIPTAAVDVQIMLKAMQTLGINITKLEDDVHQIIGCNGVFPVKKAKIFCDNSGTTFRFLTSFLALMQGEYILYGISRMHERPIKDLVTSLNSVGANISYIAKEDYPPLQILPFKHNGHNIINIDSSLSSQYLSSLLMSITLLNNDIIIKVTGKLISIPYITMTISLLAKFAIKIDQLDNSYKVHRGRLTSLSYTIEPDASSASYFLAMGALRGSVQINSLNENSLQGDKNFARILARMGALVKYNTSNIQISSQGKLKGITINMEDMPDVAMTLAVLAIFAQDETHITGLSSWQFKETNRLIAIYTELLKLGAKVTVTNNSIQIIPPQIIKQSVAIDTYNDHRIAMCFSLLAVGGIPVIIKNHECVNKTFTNYFEIFHKINYA